MRTGLRWTVAVFVVLQGLIHSLGALKGLGWSDVSQLTEPISAAGGVAWLAAAVLVVAAGALLAVNARGWWVVCLGAAVVSQAVVVTSWTDAKAGTLVNLVLLLAAGYGFASQGRRSLRGDYHRRVATALAEPLHTGVVTEVDLVSLPGPVAAYVRQSGAVGQPWITSFRARIHGRMAGRPRCAATAAGSRRIATSGEARWHTPEPDGEFCYLELDIDAITYNSGMPAVRALLRA